VRLLQRSSKPPSHFRGKILCSHHTAYIPQCRSLSIKTLSDLRRLSSRGLFDCVSIKSLFCWERDFANKHTIWAIEWPSIEVWLSNSALTTMKDIQVDWKVDTLRKRENQDLTTCRLSVRDCVGVNSIVSLLHTSLYLETSMHFYDLEFSPDPMIFRFRGAILQRPTILKYWRRRIRKGRISCIEGLSWGWYSSVAIV